MSHIYVLNLCVPGLFSQKMIAPEARRPAQSLVHPPHSEHKLFPSGMSQTDVPKQIVGSRIRREIPPIRDSLMYSKQKLAADAGCFMGRSFRVGWGPAWTLVHSGVSLTAQSQGNAFIYLFIYLFIYVWRIGLVW